VRQLLTESLILALVAAAAGTALAYAGLPAILALVPPNTIPDEAEVALNAPVLLFTLAVAALTSVVCGLAPALHGCSRDLARSMRESSRSLAGNSGQALLRKALVVGEVALSLMLLVGSGLLIRTFVALQNVDLGFEPDRVLTLRVPLAPQHYSDAAKRIAFFQELLRGVRAIPGVAAAGLNTGLHPLGNMWSAAEVPGEAPSTDPVVVHQVNAEYTTVLAIHLAAGRLFTDSDVNNVRPVALVNERFVRARLTGRDPLGRVVRLPRLRQPPFNIKDDAFQIVGVVHDTRNDGLANPVLPEIYLPFTALGIANQLVVRTGSAAAGSARAIVSQVYALDRSQPVAGVTTLDALLRDEAYSTPRFNLALFSVFAAVGLVLTIVGVYGVMSHAVAQQRHEIGVRMALGAGTGTIARMVLASGSRLLLAGIALGLVGSVATTRLLARQVWNVSPFDPLAFGVVSLILLVTGLQACLWPARRAARIDPVIALRQE
jgi:putative ABC transport system permease protein